MPIQAYHSHHVLGAWGESVVISLFGSSFIASKETRHFRADVKLISPYTGNIISIEVKTARKGKDGRYKFNLRKNKHTDLHGDFVILQAISNTGNITQYIIPSALLSGKRQAFVTDNYNGQYAKYRNARFLINRELQ